MYDCTRRVGRSCCGRRCRRSRRDSTLNDFSPSTAALSACSNGTVRRATGDAPSARGYSPWPAEGEWAAYGRDPLGARFSPLADVRRENVASLAPAWTYHTGEAAVSFATRRHTSFE